MRKACENHFLIQRRLTPTYRQQPSAVNGIAADWDKDQTYWAFYINGEYATTGISDTPITADTTYGLTLTKG